MRGRKPKPTILRLISGNPGRRPLPKDEPQPEGDLLAPPAWMSVSQMAGWRYAIEHAPPGQLKLLDRGTMTVWTVAEAMHRDATEQMEKFGMVVKGQSGVPIKSPYVAIIRETSAVMLKAGAELGFSPTARTRIRITGPAKTNRFLKFGKPR